MSTLVKACRRYPYPIGVVLDRLPVSSHVLVGHETRSSSHPHALTYPEEPTAARGNYRGIRTERTVPSQPDDLTAGAWLPELLLSCVKSP